MKKIKFKVDSKDKKIIDVYSQIKVKYEDLTINSFNGGGDGLLVADSGIEILFDIETKRVGAFGGYIGDISKFKNGNFDFELQYYEFYDIIDL